MVEVSFGKLLDLRDKGGREPYQKAVQARPHTPVYMMHKFWARRPHNVFSSLIAHYSEPDAIVLDPFCGGGVTVIEALRLKRKVVGVDLNPLATYVTEMEVKPLDVAGFWKGYEQIRVRVEHELLRLYRTSCLKCKEESASFDWLEWEQGIPKRMKYVCPKCGVAEKEAQEEDILLSGRIDEDFEKIVAKKGLWYPKAPIPRGDKTEGIIKEGYSRFSHLFTKRNLLALAMLYKEISSFLGDSNLNEFMQFAFSSSLKWASKQSHLRGDVVEGWAMHAYWVYPKTLEINVWNTFTRRCIAVARGKKCSNESIGAYYRKAESFQNLLDNSGTCLILTQSSTKLPIPDEHVDLVLTDPPFGGNVNYGELADFWIVWKDHDKIVDKSEEVIINRNQNKTLKHYEEALTQVFTECFRVLKKEGQMVVTFNSKDFRVVASFILAATEAGFVLHPRGFLYQPPIRAYATTFHAMQVGAFTGDFIFTFFKPREIWPPSTSETELEDFEEKISGLIENYVGQKTTETELRERAYMILIPFLSLHARSNIEICREAVNCFEYQMKKLEPHFKKLRKQLIEERRKMFSASVRRRKGHTR